MRGQGLWLTRRFQERHGLKQFHVRSELFRDDRDYLRMFAQVTEVLVVDSHPEQSPDSQLWITGSNFFTLFYLRKSGVCAL